MESTWLLGSIIQQDPQEMVWIESQAMLFLIIVSSLLILWVFKEFLRIRALRLDEERVREGMTSLFSPINNRERWRTPQHQ